MTSWNYCRVSTRTYELIDRLGRTAPTPGRKWAASKPILVLTSGTGFLLFAWHGQIAWVYGLTLGACQMLGAYSGSQYAIRQSPVRIRALVFWITVLSALALWGVHP